MKKMAIVIGFLMLMFPIQVNATPPQELTPIGINVELFECGTNGNLEDNFFIDIVVEKEYANLDFYNASGNGYGIFPDELEGGEYTDFDNEWISIIYFFDYPDFYNTGCSINFFSYEDLDYFSIYEFRIVVYQKDEETVTSVTYSTDLLPSYEHRDGFIFVYNPETKGFTKTAVTAEYPDSSSVWNGMEVFIAMIIFIVIIVFGLLESFVYLISRRGKEIAWISLLGNGVVLAYCYKVVSSIGLSGIWGAVLMVYIILNIYTGKVLLIRKYDENAAGVSILFSVVYSLIACIIAFRLI